MVGFYIDAPFSKAFYLCRAEHVDVPLAFMD